MVLRVLFVVSACMSALALLGYLVLLWGSTQPADEASRDFATLLLAITEGLIKLADLGAFGVGLSWLWRHQHNARARGSFRVFSPRASVLWFFVPLLRLWWVPRVVKDLARESAAHRSTAVIFGHLWLTVGLLGWALPVVVVLSLSESALWVWLALATLAAGARSVAGFLLVDQVQDALP